MNTQFIRTITLSALMTVSLSQSVFAAGGGGAGGQGGCGLKCGGNGLSPASLLEVTATHFEKTIDDKANLASTLTILKQDTRGNEDLVVTGTGACALCGANGLSPASLFELR